MIAAAIIIGFVLLGVSISLTATDVCNKWLEVKRWEAKREDAKLKEKDDESD